MYKNEKQTIPKTLKSFGKLYSVVNERGGEVMGNSFVVSINFLFQCNFQVTKSRRLYTVALQHLVTFVETLFNNQMVSKLEKIQFWTCAFLELHPSIVLENREPYYFIIISKCKEVPLSLFSYQMLASTLTTDERSIYYKVYKRKNLYQVALLSTFYKGDHGGLIIQ